MFTYVHIFFVGYNFLFICSHLQNLLSYLKSTKTHDVIFSRDTDGLSQVDGGGGRSWEAEGAEKESESEYILKAELEGFSGRPDWRYETREMKN